MDSKKKKEYLAQIKSGEINLLNIPTEDMTDKICLAAVRKDPTSVWQMRKCTPEAYYIAAKKDPYFFFTAEGAFPGTDVFDKVLEMMKPFLEEEKSASVKKRIEERIVRAQNDRKKREERASNMDGSNVKTINVF